jgi:hypothetical protein
VKRKTPVSLMKHQAVFLAAYVGLAVLSLMLTAVLSQHARVVGAAIVPFAAWAALRSFVADEGRGLRDGERRRMLANGVAQVAVLRLLSVMATNGLEDGSFLVVSVLGGTAIDSVLLTFMYWTWHVGPTSTVGNGRYNNP